MNYNFEVKITNSENAEEVSTKKYCTLKKLVHKLNSEIQKYEKEKCDVCSQCDKTFLKEELSSPEQSEYLLVCQDCLEAILAGSQQLKQHKLAH